MKRRNFLATSKRKSFQAKRFRNPDASKRRKWQLRLFFGFFTFLIAVFSIPFMLGYAPVFAFEEVSVEGLTSIPDSAVTDIVYEQMSKKKYKVFPENNQFYFQEEIVYKELQEKFDFTTLIINVEGSGVHITAEERIVEIIWTANETYYFLDLQGLIVRQLDDQERAQIDNRLNGTEEIILDPNVKKLQPNMPIIFDKSKMERTEGEKVVGDDFAMNVINLDKGVRKHQIEPKYYEIPSDTSDTLRLISDKTYQLLFSPSRDTDETLKNLNIILSDYSDRLEEISYVDLRFGNHVYIK